MWCGKRGGSDLGAVKRWVEAVSGGRGAPFQVPLISCKSLKRSIPIGIEPLMVGMFCPYPTNSLPIPATVA